MYTQGIQTIRWLSDPVECDPPDGEEVGAVGTVGNVGTLRDVGSVWFVLM